MAGRCDQSHRLQRIFSAEGFEPVPAANGPQSRITDRTAHKLGLAVISPQRSRETRASQSSEALFRLSQRLGISGIKCMMCVAGRIHHGLSWHITALLPAFSPVFADSCIGRLPRPIEVLKHGHDHAPSCVSETRPILGLQGALKDRDRPGCGGQEGPTNCLRLKSVHVHSVPHCESDSASLWWRPILRAVCAMAAPGLSSLIDRAPPAMMTAVVAVFAALLSGMATIEAILRADWRLALRRSEPRPRDCLPVACAVGRPRWQGREDERNRSGHRCSPGPYLDPDRLVIDRVGE
jgi:hypothetical protein